jgi:hypothetical protein
MNSSNQSEMSESEMSEHEKSITMEPKNAEEDMERQKKEKVESDDDSDDDSDDSDDEEEARKIAEEKAKNERRAEKKKKKIEKKMEETNAEEISTLIASIEEDKRVNDEKELLYIQERHERDKYILQKEEALRVLYKKQFEEKKTKPVKFTGVTSVGEKWKATCTKDGKSKYLGSYNTEREAAEAVDSFHRSNGTKPRNGFNYGN